MRSDPVITNNPYLHLEWPENYCVKKSCIIHTIYITQNLCYSFAVVHMIDVIAIEDITNEDPLVTQTYYSYLMGKNMRKKRND